MTTPHFDKPDKSEKAVSARRRLFQIMAVGGTAAIVLPEKWVKPVVDAVIVPAHAAGSVARASGIYGNSGGSAMVVSKANVFERFAGMLMSSAHADVLSCSDPGSGCISFDIPAFPQTLVQIYALGLTGSTQILTNNTLENKTVGALTFSNMSISASPDRLNGTITAGPNALCTSGSFSFPRVSNVCSSSPSPL
ncbi:MAG: hypothetical protein IPN53_11080 [Comamonadaceae bacterium]|nr:hypothetical protein [Comamonadaceae bacterium]